MRSLVLLIMVVLTTVSINAKGKFEVIDFGSFKLHSYATADAMADMSYIIETKK